MANIKFIGNTHIDPPDGWSTSFTINEPPVGAKKGDTIIIWLHGWIVKPYLNSNNPELGNWNLNESWIKSPYASSGYDVDVGGNNDSGYFITGYSAIYTDTTFPLTLIPKKSDGSTISLTTDRAGWSGEIIAYRGVANPRVDATPPFDKFTGFMAGVSIGPSRNLYPGKGYQADSFDKPEMYELYADTNSANGVISRFTTERHPQTFLNKVIRDVDKVWAFSEREIFKFDSNGVELWKYTISGINNNEFGKLNAILDHDGYLFFTTDAGNLFIVDKSSLSVTYKNGIYGLMSKGPNCVIFTLSKSIFIFSTETFSITKSIDLTDNLQGGSLSVAAIFHEGSNCIIAVYNNNLGSSTFLFEIDFISSNISSRKEVSISVASNRSLTNIFVKDNDLYLAMNSDVGGFLVILDINNEYIEKQFHFVSTINNLLFISCSFDENYIWVQTRVDLISCYEYETLIFKGSFSVPYSDNSNFFSGQIQSTDGKALISFLRPFWKWADYTVTDNNIISQSATNLIYSNIEEFLGNLYHGNGGSTVTKYSTSSETVTATINLPNKKVFKIASIPTVSSSDRGFLVIYSNIDQLCHKDETVNIDVTNPIYFDGNAPYAIDFTNSTTAYVTRRNSNSVIKLTKQSGGWVASTVTNVGNNPTAIHVSSLGGLNNIWVANYLSNTVSRINQSTGLVTATINVGNGPSGIATYNSSVFVINKNSNSLSEINPTTNTVISTLAVGNGPNAILFDSTNSCLWIANSNSNNVMRVVQSGITGLSVQATIPVGNNPQALCFKSGSVYVANFDDGTVSQIQTSTNTVVQTFTVGSNPNCLQVSTNNTIYVVNSGDGTVSNLSGVTRSENAVTTFVCKTSTDIVAFSGNTNCAYEINTSTNTVSKLYHSLGTAAAIFDGTSIWSVGPRGISKINPSSGVTTFTNTSITSQYGIYAFGSLWLTRKFFGTNTLIRFNPLTSLIQSEITLGSKGGMIISSPTHIWVEDNKAIRKINPTTNAIVDTIYPPFSGYGTAPNEVGRTNQMYVYGNYLYLICNEAIAKYSINSNYFTGSISFDNGDTIISSTYYNNNIWAFNYDYSTSTFSFCKYSHDPVMPSLSYQNISDQRVRLPSVAFDKKFTNQTVYDSLAPTITATGTGGDLRYCQFFFEVLTIPPLRMRQRDDSFNTPRAFGGPMGGGASSSIQSSTRKFRGSNTYL